MLICNQLDQKLRLIIFFWMFQHSALDSLLWQPWLIWPRLYQNSRSNCSFFGPVTNSTTHLNGFLTSVTSATLGTLTTSFNWESQMLFALPLILNGIHGATYIHSLISSAFRCLIKGFLYWVWFSFGDYLRLNHSDYVQGIISTPPTLLLCDAHLFCEQHGTIYADNIKEMFLLDGKNTGN